MWLIVLNELNSNNRHYTFEFKRMALFRFSHRPEVFLRKDVLRIYCKFIGEHPCRRVISIKLLCNFIKITLWHVCSPVTLLYIFRTPLDGSFCGSEMRFSKKVRFLDWKQRFYIGNMILRLETEFLHWKLAVYIANKIFR